MMMYMQIQSMGQVVKAFAKVHERFLGYMLTARYADLFVQSHVSS